MRNGRRARAGTAGRLCLAALAAFWLLVVVGAVLEPGYSHVDDYVSRLASFGSTVAVAGILAIAAFATAHAAGAWLLRQAGATAAATALALAAASGYAVAAFRIHCPDGAAGCRGEAPAGDAWTDTVHGLAVGSYEITLLLAMAATAWWALRRGDRLLGLLSAGMAVASAVTVLRVSEPAAGADQRLWLAVSTAWLVAVAVLAQLSRAGRRSGVRS